MIFFILLRMGSRPTTKNKHEVRWQVKGEGQRSQQDLKECLISFKTSRARSRMLRRILKSVLLALALRDLMVPCNLRMKSARGPTHFGADSNSRVRKCDQTSSTPPSKKRYCFLTPRLQLSALRHAPPTPPESNVEAFGYFLQGSRQRECTDQLCI